MNMKVLRKSRKRPIVGDIFVFQIRPPEYGFGRVIRTDSRLGNLDDVLMLYIYQDVSTTPTAIPRLSPHRLLIPPIGMDRSGWWYGFLWTVASMSLRKEDVLPVHCFRDAPNRYYDEYGHKLKARHEPCGIYGAGGIEFLDCVISDAMGIPESSLDRLFKPIRR